MTYPRATARLQFHKDFTFDHAYELVDYFSRLGISHIYASPILTARAGSTHGYDVVDPARINPELGGEEAFRRFARKVQDAGMGIIVDIVPNHMGVGASNAWWQHVLEWGPASPYANWFDINWESADPALRNKMLAPFLGQPYGKALAAGEIKVQFDKETGKLYVDYFGNRFPLAPQSYIEVLREAETADLMFATTAFEQLRQHIDYEAQQNSFEVACHMLQSLGISDNGREAIESALSAFSAETPEGLDLLHRLLEIQHYRLAWWRNAAEEINWRRFFEVSDLAGVRIGLNEVFEATHKKIFELYGQGLIDGVRLDHIDGLAHPALYCLKLRQRLQSLRQAHKPYIIVEKILATDEPLPPEWSVDGTTGYEFMDQVGALLHDPAGERSLSQLWSELTGSGKSFEEEVISARHQLIAENFAGEFDALARTLHAIARSDIATRDYSLAAIKRCLAALLFYFPTYRTYPHPDGRSAADKEVFSRAKAGAQSHLRRADWPLLDELDKWLGGTPPLSYGKAEMRSLCLRATTQFQQLTPPLAAKSVEDTAFYRYGRLLSRNEVGAEPNHFSSTPADFHRQCTERQKRFPHSLLATATHDHKRGEDVRMRITAISEMAIEWDQAVRRWMLLNAPVKKKIGKTTEGLPSHAPSPGDEIMLYQMLAGAWPLELDFDDEAGIKTFAERITQWQTKALRESKRSSSWVLPDEEYENACRDFLYGILAAGKPGHFLQELQSWVQRLAALGTVNSLSQTLLRLTVPGIPDLYQGTEFWDFSLVDPDNRRPVDFEARMQALSNAPEVSSGLEDWQSGVIKQQLIRQALSLRAKHPSVFSQGSYQPLEISGSRSGNVLAFIREHEGKSVISIVPRLARRLLANEIQPSIPASAWGDTALQLPTPANSTWHDVLTGRRIQVKDGCLLLSDLLAVLPLALLESDG